MSQKEIVEKKDKKLKIQHSDILVGKQKIVFTHLQNLKEAAPSIICAVKSPGTG